MSCRLFFVSNLGFNNWCIKIENLSSTIAIQWYFYRKVNIIELDFLSIGQATPCGKSKKYYTDNTQILINYIVPFTLHASENIIEADDSRLHKRKQVHGHSDVVRKEDAQCWSIPSFVKGGNANQAFLLLWPASCLCFKRCISPY